MIDFVDVLRLESQRFARLLTAELRATVPTCPDWSLADLGWHLTEVQQFWASIVAGMLSDPDEVERIERPDDTELRDTFVEQSQALLDALTTRRPEDPCWSWSSNGGTVAWVRRRQAHEALVHRIDAELAADALHAAIDPAFATDGVDEILTEMLTGVPKWGAFTPDGVHVRFETTDTDRRWDVAMGRFTGTSPDTGTTYDLDAMELLTSAPAPVDATISAAAADLDLWLWGRTSPVRLHTVGDATLVDRIRTLAAEATQ